MLGSRILKLEDLERKNLREVLQDVLEQQVAVTVQLPNGDEVIIQPKPPLKPLPTLQGRIPEGWKDAIYDEPQ